MKRKERQKTPSRGSGFANGLAIVSVFAVLCLILFGVFGKAGKIVTDFFTGVFGYSVYAYAIGGVFLGILTMLNKKRSVSGGIAALYCVAFFLVIAMIHMFSSRSYVTGGYGAYIKACYDSANTAGGWLFGLILYYPTKLYLFSQIFAALLLVGVIALLIVCQLNKEITFRARQFRFGSSKKQRNNARVQTTETYRSVPAQSEEEYPEYDEREIYNGDSEGRQLSNKFGKKRGSDPVDYVSFEDGIQEADANDYAPYYQKNESERTTQYSQNSVISDEVVDDALEVYNRRRRQEAMDKLYNKKDESAKRSDVSDAQSSWDILYGAPKKRSSSPASSATSDKSIYEGYSNNSRLKNLDENLRRMRENENSSDNSYVQDKDEESDYSYSSDNTSTQSESHEDDITTSLFNNLDKLLEDKDTESKDEKPKSMFTASMADFGEAEDKTERGDEPITGLTPSEHRQLSYEKPLEPPVQKTETKPFEPVKPVIPPKPVEPVRPQQPEQPVAKQETAKTQEPAPKPAKPVKHKPYVPPTIDCLKDYKEEIDSGVDFEEKIASVEQCLSDFGIDAKVVNVVKGPTFSRLELEVPPGISVNKIPQHYNDLAMCLAVESLRIEAPIPKKKYVGIEIPNERRGTVGLKPIINSAEFNKSKKSGLFFALGKDIDGESYVGDLTEFPHALVAGASGAGKSVCLNCMLVSMLYKYSPEDVRLILIDPKEVEFFKYEGIPHLLIPEILNSNEKIINALKWAIGEMNNRYSLLKTAFVSNIGEYNEMCLSHKDMQKIPYIVIVIDEAADIMQSKVGKEFEALVKTLTAKARAAGIHIIVATQRPSVDVITGTIKANLPTRIAFAVASSVDSKTILDYAGAEKLLRKGDMLYKLSTKPSPVRVQCAFIDAAEVLSVVEQVKNNNECYFDEEIQKAIDFVPAEEPETQVSSEGGNSGGQSDAMFVEALRLAVEMRSISISMLQRKLFLGFPRAAKLLDMMEAKGYISKPSNGNKQREVLLSMEDFNNLYPEGGEGGQEE